MFRPNKKCQVFGSASYDRYGQMTFDAVGKQYGCSVVHLFTDVEKTSVRADSSASRGNAKESGQFSEILIEKKAKIEIGYLVSIDDLKMEIRKIEPRYAVTGRLDHFHVWCDPWRSR